MLKDFYSIKDSTKNKRVDNIMKTIWGIKFNLKFTKTDLDDLLSNIFD